MAKKKLSKADYAALNRASAAGKIGLRYPPGGRAEIQVSRARHARHARKGR